MTLRRLLCASSLVALALSINPALADCNWDDTYSSVLRSVNLEEVRGGEAVARGLIYSGFGFWTDRKDYVASRELAAGLVRNCDSMIRVEVGNGFARSYMLAWVIKTRNGAWIISSQGLTVVARLMSEREWKVLQQTIDSQNVWSLNSAVDTAVSDGSTTFISYCEGGRSVQFAVYGLPSSREPDRVERRFADYVRGQRTIVRAVFELLGL